MKAEPTPATFRAFVHRMFGLIPNVIDNPRLLEQARAASAKQEDAARDLLMQLERLQQTLVPDQNSKQQEMFSRD